MNDSLEHTTFLITGASRGLGRALALHASSQGAKVALVARRRGPLDDLRAHIQARGGRAVALAYDVADKAATYKIAGEAAEALGHIDVLVNNASTLGPWGESDRPMPLLLDTACEDLDAVLQTNVVGPFRLTKAVLGGMVLRGRGAVVNITSDAAVNAYAGWGAYGASKAAFDHLGRIWAEELTGTGVHVFSVDPGEMDTAMHRAAIPGADPKTLQRPEDVAVRIVAEIARRVSP
jgi:NAD(P)-dependent dehydrogenase (short-subunit alcohol dehydrogenase family)